MTKETPLSCNMGVFTSAERESHIQNTRDLIESIQTVRTVENGYEFVFSKDTDLIRKVAEFISQEQLCCPFLSFTLHVDPSHDSISLSLTGPEGTPEFLRMEFEGAFHYP